MLEWTEKDDENVHGMTVLFFAALADNLAVVDEILASSKETLAEIIDLPFLPRAVDHDIPFPSGLAPLDIASMLSASPAIVCSLLGAGANPKRVNVTGTPTLGWIGCMGSVATVREWLERFPDDAKSSRARESALYIAVGFRFDETIQCAQMLLSRGSKPAGLNDVGVTSTVLHALGGNEYAGAAVQRLFTTCPQLGGLVNVPIRPASCKISALVRLMKMASFCRINLPGSKRLLRAIGATPLHIAVARGNAVVAKILLQAGADPMLRNAAGQTALMAAKQSYKGRPPAPILKLLDVGEENHAPARRVSYWNFSDRSKE